MAKALDTETFLTQLIKDPDVAKEYLDGMIDGSKKKVDLDNLSFLLHKGIRPSETALAKANSMVRNLLESEIIKLDSKPSAQEKLANKDGSNAAPFDIAGKNRKETKKGQHNDANNGVAVDATGTTEHTDSPLNDGGSRDHGSPISSVTNATLASFDSILSSKFGYDPAFLKHYHQLVDYASLPGVSPMNFFEIPKDGKGRNMVGPYKMHAIVAESVHALLKVNGALVATVADLQQRVNTLQEKVQELEPVHKKSRVLSPPQPTRSHYNGGYQGGIEDLMSKHRK